MWSFVVGQILKTLHRTYANLRMKPVWHDINPKAVTTDELFGYLHPATREWKDGLWSAHAPAHRDAHRDAHETHTESVETCCSGLVNVDYIYFGHFRPVLLHYEGADTTGGP